VDECNGLSGKATLIADCEIRGAERKSGPKEIAKGALCSSPSELIIHAPSKAFGAFQIF
jgi:hypothetical protein